MIKKFTWFILSCLLFTTSSSANSAPKGHEKVDTPSLSQHTEDHRTPRASTHQISSQKSTSLQTPSSQEAQKNPDKTLLMPIEWYALILYLINKCIREKIIRRALSALAFQVGLGTEETTLSIPTDGLPPPFKQIRDFGEENLSLSISGFIELFVFFRFPAFLPLVSTFVLPYAETKVYKNWILFLCFHVVEYMLEVFNVVNSIFGIQVLDKKGGEASTLQKCILAALTNSVWHELFIMLLKKLADGTSVLGPLPCLLFAFFVCAAPVIHLFLKEEVRSFPNIIAGTVLVLT